MGLIREIDHLLGACEDAERGGAAYERLGFTVTPLSRIDSLGVGNRLVLLRPRTPGTASFIECMGVTRPDGVDPAMARMLRGPEGIRSLVLAADDVHAACRGLRAVGIEMPEPLEITRQWTLPSGESLQPAFAVTVPTEAGLRFNVVQYRNIAPYTRAEWLVHANGAQHLREVYAVVAESDAAAALARFERVFGAAAQHTPLGPRFTPGTVGLTLLSPAVAGRVLPGVVPSPSSAATTRYVGVELAVRSLPLLRALLRRNGVPSTDLGSAVVTPPTSGCGVSVRFVEADA